MTEPGQPQTISASTPQRLPVDQLRSGFSPRSRLDPDHVERLVELHAQWPPIVVHADTMAVVDGSHRLAAARCLGMRSVQVVMFEGTFEQASVEAIRANVEHGLPLSLSDRKRAATDLLGRHAEWSDRFLGKVCGLAPKTIARIRADYEATTAKASDVQRPMCRLGRDGRLRPISPGALERAVSAAIAEDPGASLRTLARRTGASPETVRRIRRLLANAPAAASAARPMSQPWREDAALATTEERVEFATWFDRHCVETDECSVHIDHIPLSRVYEVIDEVRRRIGVWDTFARDLTRRTDAVRTG